MQLYQRPPHTQQQQQRQKRHQHLFSYAIITGFLLVVYAVLHWLVNG